MAKYFHFTLKGMAKSWLVSLPEGSVGSWGELCRQFITNFSRSFTHSGTRDDLLAVWQKKGETMRQYIQHFGQV